MKKSISVKMRRTMICGALSLMMLGLAGCGDSKDTKEEQASTTVEATTSEDTEADSAKDTDETTTEAASKQDNASDTDIAGVYSSKDGVITLNADGTGTIDFQDTIDITWDDTTIKTPDHSYTYTINGDTITLDLDGVQTSFTKGGEAPESDIQNPIMDFIGYYQSGRATMLVSALGDNSAEITISWASSVEDESVWEMSGECVIGEGNITINYNDCVYRHVVYDSNGDVTSDEVESSNGTGTLTFGINDKTVKWDDDSENIDEVMEFEYIQ